ncbi:MAG: hypothetical protein A3C46_00580 [Deltaproteobacteria bacterium RIFCSPHIGHO2_02_FULL_44_16]|nr:MAG: hypothetical protein A3C46_00580 [Deltaproteobacteria bacterium RIFCSPHIGHO2_02_FULL_44_16]
MNSETKTCQNCKSGFTIEPEDFAFYEKISVPPPTFCPECRYVRRLLDRNEWTFYRRKCDATGQNIISIYKSESPFPVYKQEAWWSDKWDPMNYGRDIDFSRPFFEQFNELSLKVPHLAIVNSKSVNSEYTNQSEENKDCYMLAACGKNEKCMYSNWLQDSNYFVGDSYCMEKCELCYECLNCTRCYSSTHLHDSTDCISSHFSIDLRGCSNCFGCVGLRSKSHCFFNKQLSKEEYGKAVAKFLDTRDGIEKARERFQKFSIMFPRKFYHGVKNIGAFFGDYLENTKNTVKSFNCRHDENVAYSQDAWYSKDSMDVTEIWSELSYECQGCATISRSIAMRSSWDVFDSYYSNMCFGSSNLFGCIGLRQKHYCILNRQYSKEDYEALKGKLIEHMKQIGEWGEYFPASISPFAYNESTAQDYFPLSRGEAIAKGYTWYDHPLRDYKPTVESQNLPLTIAGVSDSILKEVIQCDSQTSEEKKKKHLGCTTAFQIIPMELEFYRKMNLPLPQKCFPCRRQDRFTLRNPRKLWNRQCACVGKISINGVYQNTTSHSHGPSPCPNEFETSYAPKRPEIVYCEQCYNSEIV